jgi:hypothetical protein
MERSEELMLKLSRADGLMAEVQMELIRITEQDKQTPRAYWQDLYQVRAALSNYINSIAIHWRDTGSKSQEITKGMVNT